MVSRGRPRSRPTAAGVRETADDAPSSEGDLAHESLRKKTEGKRFPPRQPKEARTIIPRGSARFSFFRSLLQAGNAREVASDPSLRQVHSALFFSIATQSPGLAAAGSEPRPVSLLFACSNCSISSNPLRASRLSPEPAAVRRQAFPITEARMDGGKRIHRFSIRSSCVVNLRGGATGHAVSADGNGSMLRGRTNPTSRSQRSSRAESSLR